MNFNKTLAKYYEKWFRDCYDSVDYCKYHNWHEKANYYRDYAKELFELINTNWDAINFFSVDDRAFLYDEVLPIEFRNYK